MIVANTLPRLYADSGSRHYADATASHRPMPDRIVSARLAIHAFRDAPDDILRRVALRLLRRLIARTAARHGHHREARQWATQAVSIADKSGLHDASREAREIIAKPDRQLGQASSSPLPAPDRWRDLPLTERDQVYIAAMEARGALFGRRRKGEPPRTIEAVAGWIARWADRDYPRIGGGHFPAKWLRDAVVSILRDDGPTQERLRRQRHGGIL